PSKIALSESRPNVAVLACGESLCSTPRFDSIPFRLAINLHYHPPRDIRGNDGKSQTGQPQGVDSASATNLKQPLASREHVSQRLSEDFAHTDSNCIASDVLIIARCKEIVPTLNASIILFT